MNPDSLGDREYLRRFPPFVRFWFARIFIAAGVQVLAVCLGWHMYGLTHSAYDLGLVGLMQFIPRAALVLVVGSALDRYDRRVLLGLSLVIQGVVAAVLAAGCAGWWGSPDRGHLLALALLSGCALAFTMPSGQSLLSGIVPARRLAAAVTAGASAMHLSTIVSPVLGGFVYAAGAAYAYGLSCCCFAVAAALSFSVPLLQAVAVRKRVTLGSLFDGVRFIRSRPDILGALSLDLFAVLLGGATAMLPVYADRVLHIGPVGLGWLRAAPAIGALAMSFILLRHPIRRRVGRAMFIAVAVFGCATVVFGLSAWVPLSMAALVVLGAADMVSVVIRSSLIQLETPDDMRGRVSAVNSLFIGASNELGEFESGVTAAFFGLVPSVVAGGVGTLLVAVLWMRMFPSLASRDRLQAVSGG